MAKTLLAEIVTPERILYTNEVQFVAAKTTDGDVGILPLHAPLVATLEPGEVRVQIGPTASDWEWFAVSGGYLQVHEDKVIILADQAEIASQIDPTRARESAEKARAHVDELRSSGADEAELAAGEQDLRFFEVQIELAEKRK
jgi:F-type H+-transporting ATPase subunit epsilon